MPEKKTIRLGEFLIKAYDLAAVIENQAEEITGSAEQPTREWRKTTLKMALEEMENHYQTVPEFTKDEAARVMREYLIRLDEAWQEIGLPGPWSEEEIREMLPGLIKALGRAYTIIE